MAGSRIRVEDIVVIVLAVDLVVLVDAEDGANNCDVGTRRITRPEKYQKKIVKTRSSRIMKPRIDNIFSIHNMK